MLKQGDIEKLLELREILGLEGLEPSIMELIDNNKTIKSFSVTSIGKENDPVFMSSEASKFVAGDKVKLNGIEAGAEVNVQSDWTQADNSKDDFIKNKPSVPFQYTDEMAQDAVGNILTNTGNVQFTYDDNTPKITATVDLSGKEDVSNKVTAFQVTPDNSHYPSEKLVKDALDGKQAAGSYEPANANIQLHISSTSNPHAVTKAQVGLTNVDDVQQMPKSYLDTDDTLAANSDSKVPSQKAIKTYADQLIGAANAVLYKGATDCALNPNYPAADAGWLYFVSVAGKIGGASGVAVEAGDMYICRVDATPAGDQATVGASWNVIQKNIDGYVLGPSSSTDGNFSMFDGVTGKLLKNSTYNASSFLPSTTVLPSTKAAETNKFLTAYDATTGTFSNDRPTWANIDKTTSDLADLTTKSHTSLTDIGTNTHAAIDTYIATTAPSTFLKLDQTTPQSVINGSPIFDGMKLNVSRTPFTSAPGLIQWNQTDGTYDMGLLNSSVLQVGQETMFFGKASGAIANGDLCQFAGVEGDHIKIKKAVGSEIEANPHYLVGVATENIANGSFGYVTWFGKVNGIYTKTPANQDTVDWVAGDILYFNVLTGQMTKTMPSVPNRIIHVAAVIKAQTGSAENGIIIVRPTFGSKLQDLDDVNGTPLATTGQIPVWNQTGGYFDFDYNLVTQYVPYTGANANVNLGTYGLTAGGQVYLGTGTVSASYRTHISNNFSTEYSRSLFVEGRTTGTAAQISPLCVGVTSSNNMADNFGASILFSIADDANVENFIGRINSFRAGADNTGAMSFSLYKAGTLLERMRIQNSGGVSIGQTAEANYKLDVRSVASNVSAPVFTGTGLDDTFTPASTTYTGTDITTQAYYVTCDGNGTPDTFKWKKGVAGSETTGVPFSTTFTTLTDGIRIAWLSTTGHTIGDQWLITVTVSQPFQLLNAAGQKVLTTDNAGNTIIGIPTGSAAQVLEVIKTSAGALGAVASIRNLNSAANAAVSLRLNPSTANTRYAEIQAVNDGANNVEMQFFTGLGSVIAKKLTLTSAGNADFVGGLSGTRYKTVASALGTTSLRFGGSSGVVTVSEIAELNAVSTFTFSTWVTQDSLTNSDVLFSKPTGTGASNSLRINRNSATTFNIQIYNGTTAAYGTFNPQTYFTAGRLHHLVAVFDGAGALNADRLKVYIDGVEIALSFTNTIPATTNDNTGIAATISSAATNLAWLGNIKDTRIFSTALSAANVATLYATDYTTNMVHQWKMNEAAGLVATDSGSNPVNGVISGDCTWSIKEDVSINRDMNPGRLNLPAGTTRENGIFFGRDLSLYRTGTKALQLDGTSFTVSNTGAAQFVGSDTTNGITFIMGTSVAQSAAFVSSVNANPLQFRTDNTTRVTIKETTGYVGFGITAPEERVNVLGSILIQSVITDAASKYGYILNKHYTNAEKSLCVYQSGVTATDSYVAFGGGSSAYNAAKRLTFYVAADTTTVAGTRMMDLTTTGLGIGTTAPGQKLEVANGEVKIGTANGTKARLQLFQTGVKEWAIVNTATDGDFQITQGTNDNDVSLTVKKTSGNVGIGTIAPQHKVTVNGKIQLAETSLTTSGDATGTIILGGNLEYTDGRYSSAIKSILTASSPAAQNPRLGFFTQNIGTYLPADVTEKVSILGSGSVGFNTIAPTTKYQFIGTCADYINAQMSIGDTNSFSTGKMLLFGYNTTADKGFIQSAHWGTGYTDLMLQPNYGNVSIGATTVLAKLHVEATTSQLVLGYDINNYTSFTVGSANALAIVNKVAADININCGTDKTVVLTETVYNDANVGGLVLRTGGTAPGVVQWLDNDGDATGMYTIGFADGEQGSGSIEVPHDYKEGTDLVFHIHYGINDAPTGTDNIRFDLIYNVQRDGTTFVDATTIDSADVAVDTQYKTGRIDFTAITGTNFKIGDQFNFTVKRTTAVGDAFAGEVLTQTLGFHYQCDTLGSRTIGIK